MVSEHEYTRLEKVLAEHHIKHQEAVQQAMPEISSVELQLLYASLIAKTEAKLKLYQRLLFGGKEEASDGW